MTPIRLRVLAAATILSLGGLLCLQARWLWLGYRDERQSFDRAISALLARTVERIDPEDELFREISQIVEPTDEPAADTLVARALADLRATLKTDPRESVLPTSFTVLLTRATPPGYWADPPTRDTVGFHTARLHRMCARCDARIGVRLDVGPAHFLAEMGFVLATSIVLIVAQAVVVALILLSLARLRRRQDEQVAFMNTVAHEFQTPLFSIALASAVLARASSVAEDGELSRQISVIRRAKERLIEKTKRLLDVAADRSTPLVLAPQRLADLVSAAVAAVDELRDVVGATITVEGDERDASVMVHAPLIEQAITNLLENGLKYGGSPAHIIVRTRAIDSMAVVTVEDNGPGIPVQLWERVFQPFFRAANPAVQDVSGFGLGLSQVHDVARQHGGSITVSRSPIGGALFSLTLPLAVSGNSP